MCKYTHIISKSSPFYTRLQFLYCYELRNWNKQQDHLYFDEGAKPNKTHIRVLYLVEMKIENKNIHRKPYENIYLKKTVRSTDSLRKMQFWPTANNFKNCFIKRMIENKNVVVHIFDSVQRSIPLLCVHIFSTKFISICCRNRPYINNYTHI